MNGYICQGFNPLASFPDKRKIIAALSKLKYMVVMDPLATETSEFWKNYGPLQRRRSAEDPDRGDPPADDLLRRGRRLDHQLRPLAAVALERRRRRRARRSTDSEIIAELFLHLSACTRRRAARIPTRS